MDRTGAGNIFGLDSCHKLGTSKLDNLHLYSIKGWVFLDQVSDDTHLKDNYSCGYLCAGTQITATYKKYSLMAYISCGHG
jgi:hypothetical protein